MKYIDFKLKERDSEGISPEKEKKVKDFINSLDIKKISDLSFLISKLKGQFTEADNIVFQSIIDLQGDEKKFKSNVTKKIEKYFKKESNPRFKQAEQEFIALIKNTNKTLKIVWNEGEKISIYIANFNQENICVKDITKNLYFDLKDEADIEKIEKFKSFVDQLIKDELISKLPKFKSLSNELKDKLTK